MNDNSDSSDLGQILAKALKQYAASASVAERTALTHLATQLESKDTEADFRIQRVNGRLTVECKPITYTTDKRLPKKRVRKTP